MPEDSQRNVLPVISETSQTYSATFQSANCVSATPETIKELKDVVRSTESLVREIIDKLSYLNKKLEIDEDDVPI